MPQLFVPSLLWGIALLLGGCGGGSDDSLPSVAVTDDDPVTPVATSSGIEGGGAVRRLLGVEETIVVGTRTLDVSGTDLVVMVDNQVASLGDLRVGDQVTYAGSTSDDGQTILVASISQDDLVEGPVDPGSINLGAGTFSVLGQTVLVNALTSFDDSIEPDDLSGLNDGNFVEVSGILNSEGQIEASRVELEDDDDEFEVTGVVSSIEPDAFTFTLNALVIDFSNAMLEGFDAGGPSVGDRVEVEGESIIDGVLFADEVELEGADFEGVDGELGSLEGVITAIESDTEFTVNNQPVQTALTTDFEDGSADDLTIGARVEVEGSFSAEGVLIATEVEFDEEDEVSLIEIEAVIEAVDSDSGEIVVIGIPVLISEQTRFDDNDGISPVLADLSAGQFIEVVGFPSADNSGALQATRIELEDDEEDAGEASITGPVANLEEPMLTVFGVNVLLDDQTEISGQNSVSEFFAATIDGDFVEVEGRFDGGILLAEEIELEIEDDDDDDD